MSSVNRPRFSVIIPAFERPESLDRALLSVLLQTYPAHEVVICDDGSQSDLLSVANRYQDKLPIFFSRTKPSGSPARPRNIAVASATGDWLAFLDSDDGWLPNKLEVTRRSMLPGIDVLYHPLEVRRRRSRTLLDRLSNVGTRIRFSPLKHIACIGNPIPMSGSVVSTARFYAVGGFCEDKPLAEDFDLWWRIAKMEGKFAFIPTTLGWYSVSDDSISSASARNACAISRVYERNSAELPIEWLQNSASAKQLALAREMLAIGELEVARNHLEQADDLLTNLQRLKRLAGFAYSLRIAKNPD